MFTAFGIRPWFFNSSASLTSISTRVSVMGQLQDNFCNAIKLCTMNSFLVVKNNILPFSSPSRSSSNSMSARHEHFVYNFRCSIENWSNGYAVSEEAN